MKTPTPEELNAANAEFWKSRSARFRRQVEKYPVELCDAAEQREDLYGAMDRAERLQRKRQSIRAQKKRPKKRPTAKSVTIAAMRKARREGQTLEQFLASAAARSVEELEITPAGLQGVECFVIEAEELSKSEQKSKSTLKEWWSEAGKSAATD
ncbi:MAG: hypothetical protein J6T92_03645 [Ottowia sp.]|nr:hypothetical protein [Ottowia sp.]